jgi:hypothetical protein
LREWRYSEEAIMRKLVVHKIPFGPNHRRMLQALKWFLDNKTLQIHPVFKELITSLRAAQAIEYDYQKADSVWPDILDSCRLVVGNFCKPKQPLPPMVEMMEEGVGKEEVSTLNGEWF